MNIEEYEQGNVVKYGEPLREKGPNCQFYDLWLKLCMDDLE